MKIIKIKKYGTEALKERRKKLKNKENENQKDRKREKGNENKRKKKWKGNLKITEIGVENKHANEIKLKSIGKSKQGTARKEREKKTHTRA